MIKRTDILIERYHVLVSQHNDLIKKGVMQSKAELLTLLTVCKMRARAFVESKNKLWTEYLRLKHQNEKAQKTGVTFLPAVVKLAELKKREEEARTAMAEMGDALIKLLDMWQAAGATYEELLTLCNANYPGMKKQLKDFYQNNTDKQELFSRIVFVHNLDYKNPRDIGFLEDSVDAPLTHCIKEFFLDKMQNDPDIKESVHEAMCRFFPEVMENTLTVRTDEDGIQRLYDKNGECLGEV